MSRFLRWPILLTVAVLLLVIIAVWIVTRTSSSSPRVAALPTLAPLQIIPGAEAAVVQQISGSTMLLQTSKGSRQVSLPAGLSVEVLRPATANQIQAGDWLSVGGVANQVNSAAVKQVVVIPATEADTASDPHHPPRSRDGFSGFEGETDTKIGPILYGRVRAIAGAAITLDGPDGPLSVQIPPASTILRLQPGDISQIHDGDRLIFAGSNDPSSATALLARQ